MRCTECKSYIPEGALHCLECGRPAPLDNLCRKCGSAVEPGAKFCRKCGTVIENPVSDVKAEKKCPICGAKVPDGVQYCPSCGTNQDVLDGKVVLKSPPETETGPDATAQVEGETCPACGTEIRGAGRFCYACGRFMGSDVEDIICPKCGSVDSLRYSRCQYCGASIPAQPKPVNKKK